MKRLIGLVSLCLMAGMAQGGPKGPMPVITHYEIKMRVLIEEKKLSSACRLTIKNTTDKRHKELLFLLNPGLSALEGTVYADGVPQKFWQRPVGLEGYATYQLNRVNVALPEWLEPGGTATVQFNYYGPLEPYSRILSYLRDSVSDEYTLMRDEAFAYPMLMPALYEALWGERTPFTYDIEVTVPSGYIVACGGKRADARDDGATITYGFQSEAPTPRMALAVSNFEVRSDRDRRLTIYALPDSAGRSQEALDFLKSSVDFFTEQFGTPRHDHGFAVIDIPDGWGSQTGDAYFLKPLSRILKQTGKRNAYVHLAHGWTADAKPTARVTGWFDTAFTTYYQALAIREFEGEPAYTEFLKGLRESFIKRVDANEEVRFIPIAEYDSARLARNAGTKGALAIYVLHQLVGDDAFRKVVSGFLESSLGKQVDFNDFKTAAERATGKDLSKFFKEWIYGSASSDLLVRRVKIDEILARYR